MKSLGNFPDPFRAEIAGQPEALRRAAAGLADQREQLGRLRGERAEGRTVVLTGMGSSYDALYPMVAELAARHIPAVMVDTAELVHFRLGLLDEGTSVVAVSQSGESAELVRLAVHVADLDHKPTLVSVTNGLTSTLASHADIAFDTCAGHEVGPSTMTFAASVAVLAAITPVLAGGESDEAIAGVRIESGRAAAAMEGLLSDARTSEDLLRWVAGREILVLLGRGPARAAAEMGALTLKEVAGVPAESLETAQFRHGPLELAGPQLAAIVLATEPETRDLDVGLANEIAATGAAVLVVGPEPLGGPGAMRLAVGPLHRMLAPAVSLVPAQLLAWRLASERGREPGSYSRATKVTTRE